MREEGLSWNECIDWWRGCANVCSYIGNMRLLLLFRCKNVPREEG